MEPVEVIRAASLDGVAHGFLGRRGGVSTGVHRGLNVGLGSDDERECVERNRALATDALLPGGELVTFYQVHSNIALPVSAPIDVTNRPHADALVTDRPGLLLGILTADCGPVLFADKEAAVVGAAHAGWKGALSSVTDMTIMEMEKLGAERSRICAAVGPCIARQSYEVDLHFAHRFEEADPANERFFTAGRADHLQFDLEGYIVHRLAEAGIGRIEALGLDTYANAERFYSYRRATHRGEADYGRQISLIGMA